MKVAALIWMSFLLSGSSVLNIAQVREWYKAAPAKESNCKQMLKQLAPVTVSQPLLFGYKGCATMIMAKHAFNPLSKWSYFKKGKSMLEQSIAADPSNIELRYLRFTVQSNTPAFLGYKGKIESDRQFIKNNIDRVTDQQLAGMIRSVI